MLHLRAATLDDADFLYHCRIDPLTMRMMRDPSPIIPGQHVEWLEAVLCDPARRLYVADRLVQHVEHLDFVGIDHRDNLKTEMRFPVATGRLDYDMPHQHSTPIIECSWTVAPEHRGRGYASALVWLLIQEAKKEWPGVLLVANIKPENTASIRAALKVGFEIRAEGELRLERK